MLLGDGGNGIVHGSAVALKLALQVAEAFGRYGSNLPRVTVLPIYGGSSYAVQLADKGWLTACRENGPLANGINTHDGAITHGAVAGAFPDLPARELAAALA